MTLVIGYGNPMRSDDGFGPAVIAALGRPDMLAPQQLTADLALQIYVVERLILVDVTTEGQPGTVTACRVRSNRTQPGSMLHHMEPEVLLAFTEALYGTYPPTWLVTAAGESFDVGDRLSSSVQAAVPVAAALVEILMVG